MLSKTTNSIPHVCFITDGAVEDERSICSAMRAYVNNKSSIAPRISTFGIGNHDLSFFYYFLSLLFSSFFDCL